MTASNHSIAPLRVSVSELTMLRWDLAEELDRLAWHRLDAVALWRTKLSDVGPVGARRLLDRSGIRASCLKWAGGFTGGDGRTFRESVDDAREAIDVASAIGASVLVVHTGCRGGHTLGHAHRLLREAFEILVPVASAQGVVGRPVLGACPDRPSGAVRPQQAAAVAVGARARRGCPDRPAAAAVRDARGDLFGARRHGGDGLRVGRDPFRRFAACAQCRIALNHATSGGDARESPGILAVVLRFVSVCEADGRPRDGRLTGRSHRGGRRAAACHQRHTRRDCDEAHGLWGHGLHVRRRGGLPD
jgi:hypothetical protein